MKVILIIDDDPDFLSSLRLTLESAGYEAVSATGAGEGLTLFRERKPDLVISDIMMERIDSGIRLARDIREIDTAVPVFLLSDIGRITAENLEAYRLECDGVFQKPFRIDELLERIAVALRERS